MKSSFEKILEHTKYVCSAYEKTIHSTKNPCEDAYMIDPDVRWYIDEIPTYALFVKCPKCFPKETMVLKEDQEKKDKQNIEKIYKDEILHLSKRKE